MTSSEPICTLEDVKIANRTNCTAPTQEIGDYIEIVYHTLIFCLGLPLNLTSLYHQVRSYRHLTKRQQLDLKISFLLQKIHLNLANCLTLMVVCPLQIIWLSTYQWLGGNFLCKLMLFLFMFLYNISSYVIVVIAMERLRAVSSLERLWFGIIDSRKGLLFSDIRLVKHFLYISWALAAFFALPQWWVWRLEEYEFPRMNFTQCQPIWVIEKDRNHGYGELVYTTYHLVLSFWFPFILISICYIVTVSKLLGMDGAMKRRKIAKQTEPPVKVRRMREFSLPFVRSQYELIVHTAFVGAKLVENRNQLTVNQSAETLNYPRSRSHDVGMGDAAYRKSDGHVLLTEATGMPTWKLQLRSRLFRTTGLLVVAYALFWLPYNLLSLIFFLDKELAVKLDKQGNWLKALILLNAVLNPLLYRWNWK